MGNSSSGGETNAAERTRVYHRKTKSTKVEIGYTKRDGLATVQTEKVVNVYISVLDGRSNCNRCKSSSEFESGEVS